MIITIDGPTASGKSSVARAVAQKLGIYYLCSGLLFRALAYLLMKNKQYTHQMLICPLEEDVRAIFDKNRFKYLYQEGSERITFDNEDITPYLKSSDIDYAASLLSPSPIVRHNLQELQHYIAQQISFVADGRDTGSVVFPHAEYKFFLTASLQERARRWQLDQQKRGKFFTQEEAERTIDTRDQRDFKRDIGPLKIPDNGIVIDSTQLSKDEVVDLIFKQVSTKK